MSVTFSTGFHQIKPGLRVSGDEISVVFINTYDSGLYAGKKYIQIDLTNEPDLLFVEEGVDGPLETIPDVDALYNQLKDAGMTEAFEGFLVDPSDLSIISISDRQVSFDFAGHSPYIFSRNSDANATERTKVAHQTWSLPQPDFTGAVTLFGTVESPEEIEFQSIEDRLNLEASQLDELIASGMWLFATQADFPPASENHGRVVHSHADGAIFYSHAGTWHQVAREADLQTAMASLANEVTSREEQDIALSDRIDVLEADPITNARVVEIADDLQANRIQGDQVNAQEIQQEETARIAGDAASVSTANAYTDNAISELVSGAGPALDTLKELGDALTDNDDQIAALVAQIGTVESGLAQEVTDRTDGDADLDTRVAALELDPVTFTQLTNSLNAEATSRSNADSALNDRVDQNEADGDAADAALSGRLDVLEADPTTQALLDAEETARIEGDSNAIGKSNEYTDGLLNQYFGGAVTEEKATGYVAVIKTPLTATEDATANQFKFDNADVASVTAIAINHDSNAGRIDWLEVFPTGSKLRVTRVSDSAEFDFTVTQVGASGTNNRCKNFTVTTSSTGTLAAGDDLSISTVGGPDISISGDLTVGEQLTLGNGYTTGKLETYGVRASILSRFDGVSNGDPNPDSRVDVSNPSYLRLQTSNPYFANSENEYVTLELRHGYFKAKEDKNGDIFMDLGTDMEPWKKLYLHEGFDIGGTDDIGALYTHGRVEFADNLLKLHNMLRGTSINIGNNIELKPAAAGGRVEITGDLIIDASDLTNAANDNAAAATGVVVGQVYRNGSDLKVRVS